MKKQINTKKYNIMHNIGKVKYLVNFHDGESFHKDGSAFFSIKTFKNKIKLANFEKELVSKGFKKS